MLNCKIITREQITIWYNGESYTFYNDGSGAQNFQWTKIAEALSTDDYELAIELLENRENIKDDGSLGVNLSILSKFSEAEGALNFNSATGNLYVKVFGRDIEIPEPMQEKIATILQDQEGNEDYVVKFFNRLVQNPSERSILSLFDFLAQNNLPITNDGYFLAYKSVRSDYKDMHSGKFDNSVGMTCAEPRDEVEENPNVTCSRGLHFCSIEYLKRCWGGQNTPIMVLKIDPQDVVSIPTDYNNAKGRTCRYQVVAELTQDVKDKLFGLKTHQNNLWNSSVVDEEVVEKYDSDLAELPQPGEMSEENKDKAFDSMYSGTETKSYVAEVDFMTVNGFVVTETLAQSVLDFIENFEDADMSNIRQLIINKSRSTTVPERTPSRVIEKLKKRGALTGVSGNWRVTGLGF